MRTRAAGLAAGLALAALASRGAAAWRHEPPSPPVSATESAELREEVREMFHFGYDNYMRHAFPLDELRPLSCGGADTLGGYSLTLVDSLDSLALMGNHSEFEGAVQWVGEHLTFDVERTVSVFETNIRVLGGLLSAHLVASDASTGHAVEGYTGGLLRLAADLGARLLPAFDTPTGIPYGAVSLRSGVAANESVVTSTAGGGTLTLEFALLSALTGDARFGAAARAAVRALWARRSRLGLLGAHIDVTSGAWTHRDAGIGTSIDSFYEYLLKCALLLNDPECGQMFGQAHAAVEAHLSRSPWYVEVNMDSAVVVWPLLNSLQAFWPGLQALAGRPLRGGRTHAAFMSVWRRLGWLPEGFNLASYAVQPGQGSYPLRPELAESAYYLFRATGDGAYLRAGRDLVAGLRRARAPCGFATVADVATGALADGMESFFLAETTKYLYLLFDAGALQTPQQPSGDGDAASGGPSSSAAGPPFRGSSFVDAGDYVFNTEGHYLPVRDQWRAPRAQEVQEAQGTQQAQQGQGGQGAAAEGAAEVVGWAPVDEAAEDAAAASAQAGCAPGWGWAGGGGGGGGCAHGAAAAVAGAGAPPGPHAPGGWAVVPGSSDPPPPPHRLPVASAARPPPAQLLLPLPVYQPGGAPGFAVAAAAAPPRPHPAAAAFAAALAASPLAPHAAAAAAAHAGALAAALAGQHGAVGGGGGGGGGGPQPSCPAPDDDADDADDDADGAAAAGDGTAADADGAAADADGAAADAGGSAATPPAPTPAPFPPPPPPAAGDDFGPDSAPVRSLAAEVASAQTGAVAAQLLAHVAAAGGVVAAAAGAAQRLRLSVVDDGRGTQRVMLFVDGGGGGGPGGGGGGGGGGVAPVWGAAPGVVAPTGLLLAPPQHHHQQPQQVQRAQAAAAAARRHRRRRAAAAEETAAAGGEEAAGGEGEQGEDEAAAADGEAGAAAAEEDEDEYADG